MLFPLFGYCNYWSKTGLDLSIMEILSDSILS